jgi:hypothetical protein
VILGVWSPRWREKFCAPNRNRQSLRITGGFDDKARRCHMSAGLYVLLALLT